MARYIKVNPKVAKYLHLENDRLQVKDGNYILWQGDMLAFGPLPMLSETLTQIGGLSLMPHEAKQEQDGSVLRPLPVATDERFVIEEPEPEETEAEGEGDGEGQAPASESEETATDEPEADEPEAEQEETEAETDEPEAEAEDEAEPESETENENPENE